MDLLFNNLDRTKSFTDLTALAGTVPSFTSILTEDRINTYDIEIGGGMRFNYAARAVTDEIVSKLRELSEEQQVKEKYQALAGGTVMNTGEQRMVLHHLCRGQLEGPVLYQGKNLFDFYSEQKKRFYEFSDDIHGGNITGSTGKPFTTVVQIGIGGSDLGPRALYLALKNQAKTRGEQRMQAFFISNVDPDDPNEILDMIDFESSLFILVTKSGTTQETLTNRAFVLEKMKQAGIKGLQPEKHMIAVTSETSPLAGSKEYLETFFIDDFIGGRYSATSAVGGAVLSLAFGKEIFEEILQGAHEADRNALRNDFSRNAALTDAAIGIFERNFLHYPCTAILPYSQALHRFPAHLQQLDMESNGKQVNRFGSPVPYSTGPVVFGEPGTNGQHSFYQLLHQGTDIVPLQFIGFKENQTGFDLEIDGSDSQKKLNANLAAQIVAFAKGRVNEKGAKNFPGGRPSSLIYGNRLTPKALGALLAHYENKVMFQGFFWNINSFDQEGVQLGKILAAQILKGAPGDTLLSSYMSFFL